jgi:predicted PurR-regulated permease PerM
MALTAHPKVWKIIAVIFLGMTAVFAMCFYFSTIFISFVVGAALIIISEKFGSDYKKSVSRYKLPRWKRVCYGWLLIAFWVFVVAFLLRDSVNQIVGVVREISVNEQTVSGVYHTKLYPLLPPILRQEAVTVQMIGWVSRYLSALSATILSHMLAFFINGLLIIPLMFYMYFWRRQSIGEKLTEAIPRKFKSSVLRASRAMNKQLHTFFSARVVESTVVGGLCCLGFFIAGVKGWLVLGLLAGFLNTVPYFGPFLGAIPPVIITLLVDTPLAALYVVLTVLIAQMIDVFYLQPFMISSKVRIDPLLSILLVLAGTKLFGIMGTIFVLPMFLMYEVVLVEVYGELKKLYDK